MNEDSEFERRVREQLLESCEALDGRTRSRLTQLRYRALEQARRRTTVAAWRHLVPAGAVAMALLVTVFYLRQPDRTVDGVDVLASVPVSGALYDLEMLSDADIYALSADTEQDLDADFLEWAAAGVSTHGTST